MNLKPIGDKIIIKRLKAEEKTSSGIVLPDSAKEAPQQAEVVAIGPDIYSGNEIKIDDEEIIVCKLSDLLAVVK